MIIAYARVYEPNLSNVGTGRYIVLSGSVGV